MSTILKSIWQSFPNSQAPVLLLDAAIKGFVLLALAGTLCLVWRKSSAATRHLIWFGSIVGVLCCPVISWLLPAWQRPLWTVGTHLDSGNELAVVVSVVPERSSLRPAAKLQPGATARVGAGHASSIELAWLSGELKVQWIRPAIILWAAGTVLFLVLIGFDWFRLRRLPREAEPLAGDQWHFLLEELRLRLRIDRPIALLQSTRNIMPLTWGIWRPVILLPAQADAWPVERRRVVLLHELAHVKRLDCLSQLISRVACAMYWFNPWVWLASSRMCIERERACDDLVLDGGFKPSEYARHLLEVARAFPHLPRRAGIAMARSSQLKNRISSIVRPSRPTRLRPQAALALWLLLAGAVIAIGANRVGLPVEADLTAQPVLERQLAQLRSFSAAKLGQSQELARRGGEQISPEFQQFFDAAIKGDSQTVTNMYEDFKRRHPQYSRGTNEADVRLSTPYWSPVLEICLAYDHVLRCTPKYTALLSDGILNSIPPGNIYFGGTDPGRGIPTAFAKSQIDGDPFFVLTQNALADGSYLKYLREMYSGKIYTPTDQDSQRCFGDYCADALRRLDHDRQFPLEPKQVRAGENVRMENGKGAVSGQTAVMGINGLLTRLIFDQNPAKEFYIEESFPLDWMYPNLEPHGLIMKINRQPLIEMPEAVIARDREYWQKLAGEMIGDWLQEETPANQLVEFVNRIYVQKNLAGFSGDRSFVVNDYAKRLFSKLRSSIGGLYAWRASHPLNPAETQRLEREADLAFRQAFALCPYSPEALFRYTSFLSQHRRTDDAVLIADTALRLDPKNAQIQNLIQQLKADSKAR